MVMMAFSPSGVMGLVERAVKAVTRRRASGTAQAEATP
jgi:hypothetical protein